MPAYWIAHVTVTDPVRYQDYMTLARPVFAAFGATFLARGGRHANLEGEARDRHIVIAFKDFETAMACHASPEYAAARAARDGACEVTVVIVDGA